MSIFKEIKKIFFETEKSLNNKNNVVINGNNYGNIIINNDVNSYQSQSSKEKNEKEEIVYIEKEIDISNVRVLLNKVGNINLEVNEEIREEKMILKCNKSDESKFFVDCNNDTLNIKSEGNLSNFSITIRLKDLKEIENSFGNLEGSIYVQNLYINNNGLGNINLQGTSKILNVKNSGVGNTNLEGLMTQVAKVKNSGAGNLIVKTEILEEVISTGIGNTTCEAEKVGDIQISGLGNFIQKKLKSNKKKI